MPLPATSATEEVDVKLRTSRAVVTTALRISAVAAGPITVSPADAVSSSPATADPAAGIDVPTGPPAAQTTATIGRTDLQTTAGWVRTVVKLVPQPGQDLVLAELNAPVAGITPVALSTTAAVAGEQLRVAGYGRTQDEWVPLKLHTGTFSVDTVSTGEIDITGQGGAAACKGDSGGPLLRQSGGALRLVGINSRSWGGGCFGADPAETRTGTIDTRADTAAAWVSATVAGTPPLAWPGGDGGCPCPQPTPPLTRPPHH